MTVSIASRYAPPQKVAVIGAGAIGCVVADAARAKGHDVQLCVRTPVDHIVIEYDGVIHDLDVVIRSAPENAAPVDWIFVATKTQDTASTAPWLRSLVGHNTTIVVLQNGIEGADIARQIAGSARVLPSIVYIAAERRNRRKIVRFFGNRLEVPVGEAGSRLGALLHGQIDVTEQSDFTTAAWRKLICNVALNPITALTAQRFGVLTLPRVRELASGIIHEAAAVANAVGGRFSPDDIEKIVTYCCRLSPAGGTSMLYDRLSGNRLEFEHLTGTIVRLAEQHGIAVPLNKAILALLTAIDHAAATCQAAE